jgi:hypothetical protein
MEVLCHAVERATLFEEEAEQPAMPFSREESVREEDLIEVWLGKSLIDCEQVVKVGCTATAVSQNEDR